MNHRDNEPPRYEDWKEATDEVIRLQAQVNAAQRRAHTLEGLILECAIQARKKALADAAGRIIQRASEITHGTSGLGGMTVDAFLVSVAKEIEAMV